MTDAAEGAPYQWPRYITTSISDVLKLFFVDDVAWLAATYCCPADELEFFNHMLDAARPHLSFK